MGAIKEKSLVSTIDSGATYLSFMCSFNSPIPRHLFDCLQYGNREGPFYHVDDISIYPVDRGGEGSPITFGGCHFEPGAVCLLLHKCLKLQ